MKKFLFLLFFLAAFIFSERLIIKAPDGAIGNMIAPFEGRTVKKILGYHVVEFPEMKSTCSVFERLRERYPGYLIEKDAVKKALYVPDDTYYGTYQWNMKQIGIESYTELTAGDASVVVAIVDTGIYSGHPDLSGKVISGRNFTDEGSSGDYSDGHSHGTHCAGIVGANTNNALGVAGVAPLVSLMAVKVLNSSGEGSDSWVADGIVWAADNGADVISMSLGGYDYTSLLEDACAYAYAKGCVLVAATGNDGYPSVMYPAKYEGVIAVGASTINDEKASYSNTGDGIDLVAPGGDGEFTEWILSTIYDPGGEFYYAFMSGTSMACPHVSGACALLISLGITSPSAVEDLLKYTAVDMDDPGYDKETGWGRLNVLNAILSVLKDVDAGVKKGYCFPNPFEENVSIVYLSKKSGPVKMTVYNEFMEELHTVTSEVVADNKVFFSWQSGDHKYGIYYFLLSTPEGKSVIRGLKSK